PLAAIVLDVPVALCQARNDQRTDRTIPNDAIAYQSRELRHALKALASEGFEPIYVLQSQAEVDAVTIVRKPLSVDRRDEQGPFDLIGDVHGCYDELTQLLSKLGYEFAGDIASGAAVARHPHGRKAVFLGDLVDRGPNVPACLRLAMSM